MTWTLMMASRSLSRSCVSREQMFVLKIKVYETSFGRFRRASLTRLRDKWFEYQIRCCSLSLAGTLELFAQAVVLIYPYRLPIWIIVFFGSLKQIFFLLWLRLVVCPMLARSSSLHSNFEATNVIGTSSTVSFEGESSLSEIVLKDNMSWKLISNMEFFLSTLSLAKMLSLIKLSSAMAWLSVTCRPEHD